MKTNKNASNNKHQERPLLPSPSVSLLHVMSTLAKSDKEPFHRLLLSVKVSGYLCLMVHRHLTMLVVFIFFHSFFPVVFWWPVFIATVQCIDTLSFFFYWRCLASYMRSILSFTFPHKGNIFLNVKKRENLTLSREGFFKLTRYSKRTATVLVPPYYTWSIQQTWPFQCLNMYPG